MAITVDSDSFIWVVFNISQLYVRTMYNQETSHDLRGVTVVRLS